MKSSTDERENQDAPASQEDIEKENKKLKDLVGDFDKLVDQANKGQEEMDKIKTHMHDCKIPTNAKTREFDIKKYTDKLSSIEEEFAVQKKLN